MLFSLLQPLKACIPMLTTPLGIVTSVKLAQFSKTLPAMVFVPFFIVTFPDNEVLASIKCLLLYKKSPSQFEVLL